MEYRSHLVRTLVNGEGRWHNEGWVSLERTFKLISARLSSVTIWGQPLALAFSAAEGHKLKRRHRAGIVRWRVCYAQSLRTCVTRCQLNACGPAGRHNA